MFARASASSKTQDGYFDILDYECVNGAGSSRARRPGITAGVFNAPPPGDDAAPDVAWLPHAVTTHPRSAARSAAWSAPPMTAAASSITWAARTCSPGRVAVRFLPSDTVEVNVITDITRVDQQGPADKYTVQFRTTNGVPAGVANGINALEQPCRRSRVRPGGQFDGRFQTNDEYTGYHRFGFDPLSRRTTPNVNELTHWGLQTNVDWDINDTLQVHVDDVVSRVRQLVRPRLGRHADTAALRGIRRSTSSSRRVPR